MTSREAPTSSTSPAGFSTGTGALTGWSTAPASTFPSGTWTSSRSRAGTEVVGINLSGVYYCCQAVLPQMRANGAGTIVTIASWAARNLAWFPGAAYNASKRALLALTETINLEVVGEGVRATVILPEAVDTPILGQRPGGMPPAEVRANMLRPEEVVRARSPGSSRCRRSSA